MTTIIIITTNVASVIGGGVLLITVGADDDDVVAADDDTLPVATDTCAGPGRDAFDEPVGGVLEAAPARLPRRHVARPDGDEGAYADRGVGTHIEPLRH